MTSIDNQSARMLEERLALSSARIRELITETDIAEPFGEYFRKLAQFIVFSEEIRKKRLDGSFYALSEKELEKINRKLYEDVLPDEEQEMHYSVSYANPAYAAEQLGDLELLPLSGYTRCDPKSVEVRTHTQNTLNAAYHNGGCGTCQPVYM